MNNFENMELSNIESNIGKKKSISLLKSYLNDSNIQLLTFKQSVRRNRIFSKA